MAAKIVFGKLRFKNIMSFGNTFTEIDLSARDATIIRGKNGSGKSAIGDIICFVCMNKALRKINRPGLVNDKNRKDMVVEIEFTKNGVDNYMIRRGMNPEIFEIYKNGDLIPQDSLSRNYQQFLEKSIFEFNYQIFTHISLVSKAAYSSFIKLPADGRRKFVENILGLNVFSTMNSIHAKAFSATTKELQDLKNQRLVLLEKIKLQTQYIEKTRSSSVDFLKERKRIAEERYATVTADLDKLSQSTVDTLPLRQKRDALVRKWSKWNELYVKSTYKLDDITKRLKFFQNHEVCPTCQQHIDNKLKNNIIVEDTEQVNTFTQAGRELRTKADGIDAQIKELDRQIKEQDRIQNTINQLTYEIGVVREEIQRIDKEIVSASDEHSLDNELKELTESKLELERLQGDINTKEKMIGHYEAVTLMLKDGGIKSLFISRFIPIINKLVNHYLNKLDFFVRFHFDENFDEQIYSGGMLPRSYYNFSEGEKLRIDLALALTWKEVLRIRSNVSTNLMLLDEIPFDGSIDESGIEYCLEVLKSLEDTNLIIITHAVSKWDEAFDAKIDISRKASGFSTCNLVQMK